MMPSDPSMAGAYTFPSPHPSVSTARKLWTTFHAVITLGWTILLAVVELARKTILALPWLVACLTVAMFIASWLFAGPSMTVASFSDPGGAPAGNLGQTITDAFALELQRIDQLDTLKNPWGRADQVHSLWITTPPAYERVGTISVGGTQLPLGELVLALKAALPHRHPRHVITGSIRRSSSREGELVSLVVRLEEKGRILKHWSRQTVLSTEMEIQQLVRTLAFEIMWSLGKGQEAHSLENFQAYIDGVEKFRQYKDRRADADFWEAKGLFSSAIDDNPGYVKAVFYLGTLYSCAHPV